MLLNVSLTEVDLNLLGRSLEVFDGWCRDGNYTLTAEEWEAWKGLLPKLGIHPDFRKD